MNTINAQKGYFVLSHDQLMIAFVAVVFVLAIVYSAFSATTLSSNISTDGTLSVTGATTLSSTLGVTGISTFTGAVYATSTLQATGNSLFYGTLGVSGTTTPYQELGVTGDAALSTAATTTISAESTGTGVGGCLELKSAVAGEGTRWVRIYVGSTGATTSDGILPAITLSSGGRGILVIEEGRCQ